MGLHSYADMYIVHTRPTGPEIVPGLGLNVKLPVLKIQMRKCSFQLHIKYHVSCPLFVSISIHRVCK